MWTDNLTTPALVLDEARARHNLNRLVSKLRGAGVRLRPHFKTHQSHAIGRWFRDEGIDRITVTNTGMARYFVEDGWTDITIAMPVNTRELGHLNELATRCRLGLIVLDEETTDRIGMGITSNVAIWIKVDVGTHRTGLDPSDTGLLDKLVDRISRYPRLRLAGFLAHAGHTYSAGSREEVATIHTKAASLLGRLRDRYVSSYPDLRISLGDTPGAGILDDFGPVDELRPGNFIFYDLMQLAIGACEADDIAVAMACPVIATHPERLQWILHGGAIHFSKDHLRLSDGRSLYGRMVTPSAESWSTDGLAGLPYLAAMSQEHGIVQCSADTFGLARPGDMTLWLPVHSCLTADAMGGYVTPGGQRFDHFRAHIHEQ